MRASRLSRIRVKGNQRKRRTRSVPSRACGGGIGRGHEQESCVQAHPLPNPPPLAGEGSAPSARPRYASSTNERALRRGTRSTRGSGLRSEERADSVHSCVGKLLVHGKFALGKLDGSNAGDGGERLHFRARPRRRLGAVDQEGRNRRAPRQTETRVAACQ